MTRSTSTRSDLLRQAIVDLPAVGGIREYFDPETGAGYGAESFSWTAALLIDVCEGATPPCSGRSADHARPQRL